MNENWWLRGVREDGPVVRCVQPLWVQEQLIAVTWSRRSTTCPVPRTLAGVVPAKYVRCWHLFVCFRHDEVARGGGIWSPWSTPPSMKEYPLPRWCGTQDTVRFASDNCIAVGSHFADSYEGVIDGLDKQRTCTFSGDLVHP